MLDVSADANNRDGGGHGRRVWELFPGTRLQYSNKHTNQLPPSQFIIRVMVDPVASSRSVPDAGAWKWESMRKTMEDSIEG